MQDREPHPKARALRAVTRRHRHHFFFAVPVNPANSLRQRRPACISSFCSIADEFVGSSGGTRIGLDHPSPPLAKLFEGLKSPALPADAEESRGGVRGTALPSPAGTTPRSDGTTGGSHPASGETQGRAEYLRPASDRYQDLVANELHYRQSRPPPRFPEVRRPARKFPQRRLRQETGRERKATNTPANNGYVTPAGHICWLLNTGPSPARHRARASMSTPVTDAHGPTSPAISIVTAPPPQPRSTQCVPGARPARATAPRCPATGRKTATPAARNPPCRPRITYPSTWAILADHDIRSPVDHPGRRTGRSRARSRLVTPGPPQVRA